MTDKEDCVFCQKVVKRAAERITGEIGGTTIYWGFRTASFEPLNPITPGHRLFVPTNHLEHGDGREATIALSYAVHVASDYAHEKGVDFNLITSCGPAATQTIPHLHAHYIPRRPGDGLMLPWTNQ